ncbi:MAG TPA: hypothetical protein VHA30_01660, partial [Patescibacteria group bacterium]|nr:hypothetical protein [Patescibacteria group bacterium]
EDLMAEIEPRLKSLRRQAKKMEARAELEQELKIYQRELFGRTFWQLHGQLAELQQRGGKIAGRKAEAEAQAAKLRQQVDTLEAAGSSFNGQFGAVQEALQKLQGRKNKLLEDLSLVRGKMQSQKTAAAGDAQSLTVEVHDRARKIEEARAGIARNQAALTETEGKFVGQFQALDGVNKKLNELSQKLSNPAQIDWQLVDHELQSLEQSWQLFYREVQSADSLEAVKQRAGRLNDSFARFQNTAKAAVTDPQSAMAALKQELDGLLREKERLNQAVNEAQLDMGKAKLAVDFLERELKTLEQEKLHFDLELKKAQSSSPDEFWRDLVAEENRLQHDLAALAGDVAAAETALKGNYQEQERRQKELRAVEGELRQLQDHLAGIKDQENAVNVERAKLETQADLLAEEVRRILGPEEWQALQQAPPVAAAAPDLETKILRLKSQLETIGGMDDLTLKEYQETEARFGTLAAQVADLRQGMADLRQIIDELDVHIKQKFSESFHKINEKFEFYFRVLFNGGRAYLSLLKAAEDPAADAAVEAEEMDQAGQQLRPEEKLLQKYEKGSSDIVGVDIKATPPNKKLASIQALSGGERALTSIALLCSLLSCFPSPFVVLDEVDAALDDANTIRFGQILGTLAHQTQFVTITHNRETMAQANILYGVTMGDDGISKLLSVKLEQAKAYAK